MQKFYYLRFDVLSDVFTNLSAGWFGLIFAEPRINPGIDLALLTSRFVFGMITLAMANYFRNIFYEL